MDTHSKILNGIKQLSHKAHYDSSALLWDKVLQVNGTKSIDVEVDGLQYNKVQLRATPNGDGKSIVIVPDKDAMVLIGNIENGSGFVLLHCNNADKILLNGDEFGGLVKVEDLVSKLNKLEKEINNLKTIFTSWTPVPSDGGAALKALITNWGGQTLTITQKKDLENNKVKHG